MKLLRDGPDIPQELITAQEKGEVLFICGAGVSMTLGLPSFRGLVVAVYEALGENWRLHPAEREVMEPNGRLSGQYDRVLRSLERRMTAAGGGQANRLRRRLRDAVREKLQPPSNKDLDLNTHAALLELSRDAESNVRLVTTNFDTLFERAWPRSGEPPSFAGAAMPQPKSAGCAGVLHLHGRLADEPLGLPETDLVLTSAEFGDAYLRSGWASRYVYDLVRAYTVVLVGYQADDPPMRYLLEVLEADRQRYSDLQKVYAFAAADGDEALTRAMWEGKGVTPILHEVDGESYEPLYRSIVEWRNYAQDPTSWRRDQLRVLFATDPADSTATIERIAELLRHGDASLLLSELDPPPAWLPLLRQQRIFDNGAASPGGWIAKRLNDPDMIRAAVAHPAFDENSKWYIERELNERRDKLGPVRALSWDILLSDAKSNAERDHDFTWYRLSPRIRAGEAGYEARRLVANLLRPRLKVERAYRLYDESTEPKRGAPTAENLFSFMWLRFETSGHVAFDEIVNVWPRVSSAVGRLLQVLERTLVDSLEQAEDLALTVGYDVTDRDVPSVALHAQNAYHTGFYPIVRVMADLWVRLNELAPERALALSRLWIGAPFVLLQRLAIFAATTIDQPADDLASMIMALDDHAFWASGAQVELMRGLVARWEDFTPEARSKIEARLAGGIPRHLFSDDAFDEDDWISVFDNSIYRRLSRLQANGGRLSGDSKALMKQIARRHPKWRPSEGDRDDFHSWSESRTGPDGDVDLLKDIPDRALVGEALRIESERQFDQGDLWRKLCSSDPERALRGLSADAKAEIWNVYAWRSLIWATDETFDTPLKLAIADGVLSMPAAPFGELVGTIADWIRNHRAVLDDQDGGGVSRLWLLWDRLAAIIYSDSTAPDPRGEDLIGRSLNLPGGVLAWTLINHLSASKPMPDTGLGDLESRFSLIVHAESDAGLLGRIHFASAINYLYQTAPAWTSAEMLPRFQLEHAETLAMWKANAQARAGSAALFNALKLPLLAVIPRPELSDDESGNLATRLFDIVISHQRGSAQGYHLDSAEIRDLLVVSRGRLREHFAWLLWRLQSDKAQKAHGPVASGDRWRRLVGPIFRQIWPLDPQLRTSRASQNLVQMVIDTDDAFPEAVDAAIDVLAPYEIYSLENIFRGEETHATLVERYPRSVVKLVDALVDPLLHPVPRDLGRLLDNCQQQDPQIVHDPAFLRLDGFRRLGGA